MKHVTFLSSLLDFLRKISISLEPKRNTMHLIFLPTLKLQGTEGSQGLHRSFPRCLPHLRSAEEKNGCISNTYLEQMCHELHWTMRRKIINKRHGCYFLVASILTTLKIGNPETNTEWTPLKINVVGRWNFLLGQKALFRGELLASGSVKNVDIKKKQQKTSIILQKHRPFRSIFPESIMKSSFTRTCTGNGKKNTNTLNPFGYFGKKSHQSEDHLAWDPEKNACFFVEHLTFCTLPCGKLHLTYIKRRVPSSYKHRSLPKNEINCKCKFFPLVMKHFYKLRTLTLNQVEEFCCRE